MVRRGMRHTHSVRSISLLSVLLLTAVGRADGPELAQQRRAFAVKYRAQIEEARREWEAREVRERRGLSAPRSIELTPGQVLTQEMLRGWHFKGPSETLDVADAATGSVVKYAIQGVDLTRVKKELRLKTAFTEQDRIVVGIEDGGTNIYHDDIAPYAFRNVAELRGQRGASDDGNAYVDDISGWDFIGAGIAADTLEVTRVKAMCDAGEMTHDQGKGTACADIQSDYDASVADCAGDVAFYGRYYPTLAAVDARFELGLLGPSGTIAAAWEKMKPLPYGQSRYDAREALRTAMIGRIFPALEGASETARDLYARVPAWNLTEKPGEGNTDKAIVAWLLARLWGADHFRWIQNSVGAERTCAFRHGADFVAKRTPGYDASDPSRPYGSLQSAGHRTSHGTHVAGIVVGLMKEALGEAASRGALSIMSLRVTPDADERDHDVANALRYAVDNGADLVNMSFGKVYSPYKDYVDASFAYAEKKGVALMLSAGNDAHELTPTAHFPTAFHRREGGRRFANVVVVGASNFVQAPIARERVALADRKLANSANHKQIMAAFSNYSKGLVDLFAPGTMIYAPYSESITEKDSWAFLQGTSMATPVTTGVAALVLSQVSELRHRAADLRAILLASVRRLDGAESTISGKSVKFEDASLAGGIIDAYAALCNASRWSQARGGTGIEGCAR